MRRLLTLFVVLCAVLAIPSFVLAQEWASLTGVVTDKSGAVVPDVAVQLIDTKTKSTYQTSTNSVGVYTFPNLVPGPGYKIVFKKASFATVEVANVYVAVNSSHTQNATLELGTVSQTIEVAGAGQSVTLDTTDATIGNNFDMRALHELPIQVRDSPAALLALQPGVATAEQAGDDPNSSREGAVTGARTVQGNITLDLVLTSTTSEAGQAFATVANAPVDSIQEFRGETANPLAAAAAGAARRLNW